MAKSNLRYITVSDTETSGLPSKGGKGKEPVLAFHDILLVEVAAVVIDIWDMRIVDEYDVIIKPYVDKYVWQPQAEATHGLSQDHLFKNGVDIKEAYRGYASILSKYKNPKVGAVLCGHNFQGFDIPFIEEMFKWNKDDLYNYVRWVEDTQKMAYYRAIEQENYKLGTCCRLEGVELVDAHRALVDTRANAQLMLKYIEHMRGTGGSSPVAAVSFTRKESRFRERFQLV